MTQHHPSPGQLWKSGSDPVYYIFIDKVEGIKGGTEIVYFTTIASGRKYETYVKGIQASYKLVSG